MNFIVPSWIWKVAIALALFAGVAYMVFDNGRTYERAIATVKADKARQAAQERYDKEVERARIAAEDYGVQHRALREKFDNLKETMDDLRRKTPLIVPAPRQLRPAAAAGAPAAPALPRASAPSGTTGLSAGAAAGATGSAQPRTTQEFPPPHSALEPDQADEKFAPAALVFVAASAAAELELADAPPRLSLGAVRLWNSDLAGIDLPAGACGVAGAADGACAAASGTDLDAAWRNHSRNAESCALDRQRFQALIDYLQQRRAFNAAGAAAREAVP